jgi:hypothetical protein
MGTTHSKQGGNKGQVLASKAAPPPPYLGELVPYHFINLNIPLQMNVQFSFLSPGVTLNTTNVDNYFPHLMQMYEQGFRMLTFTGVPGSVTSHGLSSIGTQTSNLKFQGIERGRYTNIIHPEVCESVHIVMQLIYMMNSTLF